MILKIGPDQTVRPVQPGTDINLIRYTCKTKNYTKKHKKAELQIQL